jgi:steroid delta-isomerase
MRREPGGVQLDAGTAREVLVFDLAQPDPDPTRKPGLKRGGPCPMLKRSRPIRGRGEPMPTPDRMRATLQRYLELVARHDVEGVLSLFAESISVEDPVGGPPGTHVVGREAVASFFRRGFARSRPRPALAGPIVTTAGDEAAMAFTLELQLGEERCELDVVDVVRFDAKGRIVSLRAFWNLDEARPL